MAMGEGGQERNLSRGTQIHTQHLCLLESWMLLAGKEKKTMMGLVVVKTERKEGGTQSCDNKRNRLRNSNFEDMRMSHSIMCPPSTPMEPLMGIILNCPSIFTLTMQRPPSEPVTKGIIWHRWQPG